MTPFAVFAIFVVPGGIFFLLAWAAIPKHFFEQWRCAVQLEIVRRLPRRRVKQARAELSTTFLEEIISNPDTYGDTAVELAQEELAKVRSKR